MSASASYEPILVTEFVAELLNSRDLSRKLSEQDLIKVMEALRGIRVDTTHLGYIRTYKINGLSDEPMNQTRLNDGSNILDYFRERYGISLNYQSLPALQAGNDTKPTYLPMELCMMVALSKASCQRPYDKEKSMRQMNKHDEEPLGEFGMFMEEELTSIEARVLPPPTLIYQDENGRDALFHPQMGRWSLNKKKMVDGGRVDTWMCLNLSSLNQNVTHQICDRLVKMCRSKGMDFNPQPVLPLWDGQPEQIETVLADINRETRARLAKMNLPRKELQLLVIILPDVTGCYGKIKRICETELGIVSQCCQPGQAANMSDLQLESLAMKINVKVGGRNTVLNDAILRRIPLVTDRPTIIFGAGVAHPQSGDDTKTSIAAVVASMDWPELTKYRGLVSAQTEGQETIQDLYIPKQTPEGEAGGMVRELLLAFRRSTGHKPSRMIFYRDGVSDGQFSSFFLSEMDAIRQACGSLETDYLPPVTFIVVQKGHHTSMDKGGNILPGAVVDTNIYNPTEFGFYLNSHARIQGTSRPSHYHVLLNENGFNADNVQTLTNNLCYTHARCTSSVSVVPPVYYAQLVAIRARYYIEEGPPAEFGPIPIKDNVKDVMFYC